MGEKENSNGLQGYVINAIRYVIGAIFFVVFVLLPVSLLISPFSMWIDLMLSYLSIQIKDFLQIFVPHTINDIQSLFYVLLVILLLVSILGIVYSFLYSSENHKKKTPFLFLSFYITLLLGFPLILGAVLFSIKLEIIFIVSVLIYSIFFLLRLCSNHSVLDILLLIWPIIEIIIGVWLPTPQTPLWFKIGVLFIIILLMLLVLWKIKENVYLFCWDNVSENNNDFIKFLRYELKIDWAENATIIESKDKKTITVTDKNNKSNSIILTLNQTKKKVTVTLDGSKKKEYIVKEKENKQYIRYKKLIDYLFEIIKYIYKKLIDYLFEIIKHILSEIKLDTPEFRLVNKIYILTILTLTLFTIGTIFIYGFTHVEDYTHLNITNATSPYICSCSNTYIQNTSNSSNSSICNITCNNDVSSTCNIYSENSINIANATLTVKNNKDNREYTLTISSLCKQYDQNKKDFVTYFSTLIGAVIAFFATMYNMFIRTRRGNNEKPKNDKNQT